MRRPLSLLVIAMTVFAAALRADTVTGVVVDQNGAGVAGVVVDFNHGVTPLNNVTGAGGTFSVDVPPDCYDITFTPPAASGLATAFLLAIDVLGTTNVGTVTLFPANFVTGTVVDALGNPVAGADIDAFDASTGAFIPLSNDTTDAVGGFSVLLPFGTFDIRVEPAPGVLLVATLVPDVMALGGTTSIGTIVMQTGFLLSGTVVSAATSAPIAGVDIDVDVVATGMRVVTPGDDTDSAGTFTVIVPAGNLRVTFEPPTGNPHVALELPSVFVGANLSLGTIPLAPGFFLSGTVLGPGGVPVVGADIDLNTVLGDQSVFIAQDTTNGAGNFQIVVPGGSFHVTVEPKLATGLVGQRSAALTVAANATVPTFNLQAGVVLSGIVTAYNGIPETGANIDVFDTVSGQEIVTPGDSTNAAGQYAVIVPTGTFEVRVHTRKVSLSRDATLPSLAVTGPTTANFALTLVPTFVYLAAANLAVNPTVAPGGPVSIDIAFYNPSFTQLRTANVDIRFIDPAGGVTQPYPVFPIFLSPLQVVFALSLPIPVPAMNPAYVGLSSRMRIILTNPVTGAEIDRDDFRFTVQ